MSDDKWQDRELENFSAKLRHLSYTGHDCKCIPDFILGKNSGQTRQLNLGHNNINILNYLDSFNKLEELNLDNNEIDDVTVFPPIETLTSLSLNNNRLTNLKRLVHKLSRSYPALVYLSLLGNLACPNELSSDSYNELDYQRYRCYVSCHMKALRFLDWRPITDAERLKGRELFQLASSNEVDPHPLATPYSPLPKTDKPSSSEESRAVAGKIRYKYVGLKSEGNRFIKNNDL
ncbi:leucine-rich melanocyte differentiation-associated protein-like [Clavelina lepadiformis]|uniref:leucine-rich melanocyte differentiation-associated protein-like n=1 Tax=Clavelina lepadiformis TaxID=159417 RepID=UPI00404202C4